MANGDIIELDRYHFMIKLLDAQTAASDGVWVEIPARYNIRSFTSTALEEGASDATVDIYVSNATTKPADNSTAETVITQTLNTTTQGATKVETYRWVKAKKTAGTTPVATTVIMVAAVQA